MAHGVVDNMTELPCTLHSCVYYLGITDGILEAVLKRGGSNLTSLRFHSLQQSITGYGLKLIGIMVITTVVCTHVIRKILWCSGGIGHLWSIYEPADCKQTRPEMSRSTGIYI